MLVRAYTDADLDALRAMHVAQGFAYELPDVNDPLFLVRMVLEDDDAAVQGTPGAAQVPGKGSLGTKNVPRMAALLRLTAETYLLADPRDGTPRQRWQWLTALHEATRQAAAAHGLADVQAFLPPSVARAFGRRLDKLGWRRDPWPCYTRAVR